MPSPSTLDTLVFLVGQASFALIAVSYAMTRLLWLRLLAIASGVLGVVFNAYLASVAGPDASGPLWTVVAWLSLFLAINAGLSLKLLHDSLEVSVTDPTRQFGAATVPMMRSRDLTALVDAAETYRLADGEALLDIGESTDSLWCVVEGSLRERREDGDVWRIPRFGMVGDASWLVPDAREGSPSRIEADGDTVLYRWPYPVLHALIKAHPAIAAALSDGIARGMVRKRAFLRFDDGLHVETFLALPNRRLHAVAFPHMRTSTYKSLVDLAMVEAATAGDVLSSGPLRLIERGRVRVVRADGHSLILTTGQFIGEIGWLVAERHQAVPVQVTALEDCRFRVWTRDQMREMDTTKPVLMAGLLRAVARDVAVKLSLPMQADRVDPHAKALSL